MKVYIAGPMTGLPEFNFPAFHAAAADWKHEGWQVVNPADAFDGVTDRPYADYIRKDVADICGVDAIAFLPGWEKSKGARLEHALGKALGLALYDAGLFTPLSEPAETVLQEANRLVYGDRQADYGHPIEDFTRTGRMWGAILGIPDVDPAKVALCMCAVKMSRECNRPKRDNAVDLAGYAGTLAMVRERQGA